MQRKVERMNCMMWVNDNIMRRTAFDKLLYTLDAVIGYVKRVSSYAAAHKHMLHDISIE